jgi:hypothetical protein
MLCVVILETFMTMYEILSLIMTRRDVSYDYG